MALDILPGDFVQARLNTPDGAEDQWLITEFVVTSIEGNYVHGSVHFDPVGITLDDGWSFEVISRNLSFPMDLCVINATLYDDTVHTLMGMGNIWTDTETGQTVPTETIKSYTK